MLRCAIGLGCGVIGHVVYAQVGAPAEEDLKHWGHHSDASTLPDAIMRSVGADLPGVISFVFSNQVGVPVMCYITGMRLLGSVMQG